MMNGDELFGRLQRGLIDHHISFVRLACDMLLLYVDCKPGDGRGLTFWFNPPWQVTGPDGVIADSHEIQGEGDDGPTAAELDRVSGPICEKLIDQSITEVRVDQRSRDIKVTMGGTYHVRAIASDLQVDHLWHIRENTTGLKLYASTAGWRVRVGKV